MRESACARGSATASSRPSGREAMTGRWRNGRPDDLRTAFWRGVVSGVADVYDALVIGGGPAGATTALLLARAGWSVALVERSPFPRRKVCGEFLSATNLPLLRHLGVGDAFRDLAGPEVRRVVLFARDRQ